MRTAIIEDEPLALSRLEKIIRQYRPDWDVLYKGQSIKELNSILEEKDAIDLLLCDIHLADGLSFKALKGKSLNFPVIFITAYDEYALRSFDHNCIDYILKPIDEERLLRSFEKVESFGKNTVNEQFTPDFFEKIIREYQTKTYKKRFLSKIGKRIRFVPAEDVSYFLSEGGVTYLVERESNKKYLVDYSLQELEEFLLDPNKFYRINRSTIIHLDALNEMKPYINGRLLLSMNVVSDTKIIVARERVQDFKIWINQ
ncbi:Two-component system response regulator [Indibacter alkaliphilus LW1]|jgi:two-component system response regulator LytT|uniref:Two-component system response regulator n=1 Tax=Indibacter alkaliphilus (strain CCUG 57479 / KCTC 22604 / LW1) TaxID=1189612 RepID=S2DIC2_INDAL|nr:LytTR family DNA-binding domain-containing protein [Indibacter alkaliphilus]EOZ96950.1 Two-component system response regulator [Indibacter alkaliphilus LW1]